MFISTIGWECINKILHKLNNKDRIYNSRYCSNIHALIIFIYSLNICYNENHNIDTTNVMNGITAGYAIFDMYRAIKYKEVQYVIHHLVLLFAILPAGLSEMGLYILPYNYYSLIARAFLSESSTIFLNNCWLLIINKKQNTTLFQLNCMLVLIFFTLFRIINFTNILYILYLDRNYPFLLIQTPLTVLNYYWYKKLIDKYINLFYKNE